jgi:type II secretory pathway component GspD/PulD (secretin)
MLHPLLLAAVFVGPPITASPGTLQEEYRELMVATRATARPESEEVVPRIVALYTKLNDAETLPRGERSRMRTALEGRLVRQLEQLLIEKRKHETGRERERTRGVLQAPAGGGATAFAAQHLIDLIVTTISPETWRRNGGNGSISFYPNNPALVIRQTSEVHDEIQNLLRDLR